MNNKRNIRKRLIILGVVLVIIIGAVIGVNRYMAYRNDQKTVEVMPMAYVSSTYWGDQTSCDGNIVSDYIQELYPDSSKHIDEIFVEEGQSVSVGDPLLQYDRTSLELDVEAKQIAQQQVQVRIDEANRMLKKLQKSKPISTSSSNGGGTTVIIRPTPKPTATPKPTPTPKPTAAPTAVPTPTPFPTPDVAVYDELTPESIPYKGTGTSEDPYVFLCKDGFTLTPEFMRLLFGLNDAPSTPEPDQPDQPDPGSDDLSTQEPGEEVGEGETPVEYLTSEQENSPETTTSVLGSPFAAVFEVREHDSNYGELLSAVTLDGHKLSGALSVAGLMNGVKAAQEVITTVAESEPEYLYATPTPKPTATPAPDNYDGMYTKTELDALIKEKKQEISQLQYNLKQAKLDLEKAQRALDNSTVTSTIDGEIRSLIDIDTAMAESRPFMVVSGAQQYYVNGTISENLLGSIAPGDEVTVNSWMNGMTYTAQIVSISDYPTENGYYYGTGNPNSSNYEFTAVLLDADDTIQNGSYVDITLNINDTSPSDAFYLQKMYIREDDYGYYVMKAGKDNRLVKEHITVGKSIWGGEALEIKTGLTMEDFVAFPYGPDTKEGVRVVLQETGEPPWPEEGDDGADDSSGLPDDDYGGEDPGMDIDFAVPDTFDEEMEVE